MLERFYPDEWLDSVYGISWESLYRKGMRGVIFDVDNTLVPHGMPADEKASKLFEELRQIGFKTFLLSNNKEGRVASFAYEVNSPYISRAGKPSAKSYLLAVEQMGIEKEQAIFVGDQLFTDVYGAKRAGIYNMLVHPIHPKEEIQIVLKRYAEAIVLYFYRKKCEK